MSNDAMKAISWIDRDCPVCGQKGRRKLWTDRNRREGYAIEATMHVCYTCNTGYLSPIPAADSWLSTYQDSMTGETVSLNQLGRFADRLVDTWSNIWSPGNRLHGEPTELGSDKTLLEIGCGYGERLLKFADQGYQIVGVDVNEAALESAARRLDGRFLLGAFEDIELEPESFDVIRFDNVLDHSYEPKLFMEKVAGLLKPGGKCIGFVPNGRSASIRLLGKYSINNWVPYHITMFNKQSLQDLATQAGLVAEVRGIANPHWFSLSVRQYRYQRKTTGYSQLKAWDTRLSTLVAAPIWAVLSRFGWGEELVLTGTKSYNQ